MTDFDVIVLNRASRPDRREHMESQLLQAEWPLGGLGKNLTTSAEDGVHRVLRPPAYDHLDMPPQVQLVQRTFSQEYFSLTAQAHPDGHLVLLGRASIVQHITRMRMTASASPRLPGAPDSAQMPPLRSQVLSPRWRQVGTGHPTVESMRLVMPGAPIEMQRQAMSSLLKPARWTAHTSHWQRDSAHVHTTDIYNQQKPVDPTSRGTEQVAASTGANAFGAADDLHRSVSFCTLLCSSPSALWL